MPRPGRILVVKLSDIGDVLTATPALRALRQTFHDARIDVLAPPRSAAVLQGSPLVDEVIVFNKFEYDRVSDALSFGALRSAQSFLSALRSRHYDTLVLLHHLSTRWGALKWAALSLAVGATVRVGLDNGRGWFLTHRARDDGFGARHEVEYGMAVVQAVGAKTEDLRLEIGISEADQLTASQLLQSPATNLQPRLAAPALHPAGQVGERSSIFNSQSPMIVLHPGSGGHSLARRWPLERWADVGRALSERHSAQIVIVGTADDGGDELAAQLPSALNLTGKTTLPQLAAVLQRCRLFIGADSGVMHVAAAAGVPIVALFGTTNAQAWGPWCPDGRCVVVRSETPGCPCAYVGFKIRSDECEARECMKGIAVERVLAAVERVWEYGSVGA